MLNSLSVSILSGHEAVGAKNHVKLEQFCCKNKLLQGKKLTCTPKYNLESLLNLVFGLWEECPKKIQKENRQTPHRIRAF